MLLTSGAKTAAGGINIAASATPGAATPAKHATANNVLSIMFPISRPIVNRKAKINVASPKAISITLHEFTIRSNKGKGRAAQICNYGVWPSIPAVQAPAPSRSGERR